MTRTHLAFAFLLPMFLSAIVSGCKATPRGIRVISSVPNPENGHGDLPNLTAQVIEEDYGATVANITTVRLITSDGKPFAQGDGGVFSYYRGKPRISVSWKDGEHLVIDCPDCTDNQSITLKEVKHNRIEVLYSH